MGLPRIWDWMNVHLLLYHNDKNPSDAGMAGKDVVIFQGLAKILPIPFARPSDKGMRCKKGGFLEL